jgi:hypothetical protein
MKSIIESLIVEMVKGNGNFDNASDIIDCLTTDHIDELKNMLWNHYVHKLNYTAMLKKLWIIKEEQEESESESETE